MPRYVSPGRTPSPSRSPSRTSRGGARRPYTDGVYSPTASSASRSPSPARRSRSRTTTTRSARSRRARTPSSDYYTSSYSSSRSRSRSPSRSTRRGPRSAKDRIAAALDTSDSTAKEKAGSVVKTSLVMLGAIGAASLAAHKFWPKGITYGDKEAWEEEHEKKDKLKGKLKEGRDAIEGAGSSTEPDPDRRRYIEERYRRRPALPPSMDGDDGAQFWEQRERLVPRQDRGPPQRYLAYEPHDDDDNADNPPPPTRRRIAAAAAPIPERDDQTNRAEPARSRAGGSDAGDAPYRRRIAAAAPIPERDDQTNRAEPARSRAGGGSDRGDPGEGSETSRRRLIEVLQPPPPPAAPVPPRTYIESAPAPVVVVPGSSSGGGSRSGGGGGGRPQPRYYVDGDTIVVPSAGERVFVVQRDAPPGSRLRRGEGETGYYR